MPIPKPQAGESQDDFISRCMANDTMVNDFSDESQRYAVCIDQVKQAQKNSDVVAQAVDEFMKNMKK